MGNLGFGLIIPFMRTINLYKPSLNKSRCFQMKGSQQVILHFTPAKQGQELALTLTDQEAKRLADYLLSIYGGLPGIRSQEAAQA